MAGAPEEKEELTGLEWEAEKAYIMATSPRSVFYSANNTQSSTETDDEFNWKVESSGKEAIAAADRVSSQALEGDFSAENQIKELQEKDKEKEEEIMDTVQSFKDVELEDHSPPPREKPSPSNIIVVYGPSGIGRSSLVKKLVYRSPRRFALVVSHTTRQPRADESYARDYYFVSRKDMMHKIKQGKFMEYVQIDRPDVHSYAYSEGALPPRKSYSALTPTSPIITATSSEGDLYGTTWEAFNEAQSSGKPWTIFNLSTKGAEQIKQLGVEGHYILMHHDSSEAATTLSNIQPERVIELGDKDEAFAFLENHVLSLNGQGDEGSTGAEPPLDKPTSKLEVAKNDWERVPTVQIVTKRSTRRKARKQSGSQKVTTTYVELLSHFQMSNLSPQLSSIKPEIETSRLSKFFGPPKLAKKLKGERNLIFAIALCKFNDQNPLHFRALSTVYRHLTKSSAPCPRFGPHWEDIGFQGGDPTDDLRGVGMLGVMQMVWFLETPNVRSIAGDIYRYSKDTSYPLPFCVVSLNVTRIVLQALRENCLSRECNKREQVFAVFNDLYAAIFLSFFHNWKRKCKDVMEMGNILQDVGNFAKKNVHYMIRELEGFVKDREKEIMTAGMSDVTVEPSVEFSKMEPS